MHDIASAAAPLENDAEAAEAALAKGGDGADWWHEYGLRCYRSQHAQGASPPLRPRFVPWP